MFQLNFFRQQNEPNFLVPPYWDRGLPINIMCVGFGCVEKIAVMKIYYGMNLYIYNTRVGLWSTLHFVAAV